MDVRRAERALAARDVAALSDAIGRLCQTSPDPRFVTDLVKFALDPLAPPPIDGERAIPFIWSIQDASRTLLYGEPLREIRHRVIGLPLDFLGETDAEDVWGAEQWLNLIMLGQIRPKRRAAVVVPMRDDGIYLLEWIGYYRALGFDRIFIYTNDNADGSARLLLQLAKLDVITLIESRTSGAVRPEIKAFNHAVHLLHDLRDFEWVLFVDSDEFLYPAARFDHAIGNVLDELERSSPDNSIGAVAYHWRWYNSAMVFEREPGLLAERFKYATPHWLTKSLVRLTDVLSMRQQHIPDLKPGRRIVNSSFQPLDTNADWEAWPVDYSGGRINHYWPKSFEEFAIKKARGETLTLPDNEYARDFRLFFEWNGPDTPETYAPIDESFLVRVRAEISELRHLDGVAAREEDVERGFRRLLARYNEAGGLRRIYDAITG